MVCFTAGYVIGKSPELYEKIDLTETEIYFYLEDSSVLSAENRERLATLSGTKIHFNEKDMPENDIILSKTSSLVKQWPSSKKLKNLEKLQLSYQKISPDFIFRDYEPLKIVPLLWRAQDKKTIEISAMQITPNAYIKKAAVLRILEIIISKDFQEKWIPGIQWNTTIKDLSQSSVPETQRPESLRSSNLSNLQISK